TGRSGWARRAAPAVCSWRRVAEPRPPPLPVPSVLTPRLRLAASCVLPGIAARAAARRVLIVRVLRRPVLGEVHPRVALRHAREPRAPLRVDLAGADGDVRAA